jgi:Guanylate-binding protein, N-terminal domain
MATSLHTLWQCLLPPLLHGKTRATRAICAEEGNVAKEMASYTRDLLEDVLEVTRKPHGQTLVLRPVTHTCVADALQQAAANGDAMRLGAWLRRTMCLVPQQISRCNGNTLEPMHDGEPRRDAADDGDDIVERSKQLRWGLYECLLNSHAGPVVVVCALGQQSVGKSYQLNHLGGVFFDVAGGRCTDGVWLSARPFTDKEGQERLALFLDCEGIGSLERTDMEDMLHCLLAGAISNLKMFKTHFVFDKCAFTDLLIRMSARAVPLHVQMLLELRHGELPGGTSVINHTLGTGSCGRRWSV